MQVLTRETVELARHIRRQLRQLGYEVPALSDPELVERLEALAADTRDTGLQQAAARLRALLDPSPSTADASVAGSAEEPPDSLPSVDAGAHPDAASRPRRYYRGVPIED
ncbi:hypothetical protein [Sediminicurvatus halobius]|uniref:Uncharacterized protein n=1 Tax=Sediminicurvatus halobius TaxID=2182432 RepID=A0A2U2N8G3_9GAMM|nr:hypothetical protein [Spiribacter halobius]PWG65485.1 hypothetical protein DEM34_01720 [Spiribacter halobius]UEX76508.1 hypothetical protein LMH63_11095 [Spiribacter halobius]